MKYHNLAFYVVGQGIAYGIDIGVFYLLTTTLDATWVIAYNTIGKIVSALFAYHFHSYFTFPGAKANSTITSVGYFVLVVIANMIITGAIIAAFQILLAENIVWMKIGADVFAIVVTFILMRRFVFPRAQQE